MEIVKNNKLIFILYNFNYNVILNKIIAWKFK
jgi:hypothetical protein